MQIKYFFVTTFLFLLISSCSHNTWHENRVKGCGFEVRFIDANGKKLAENLKMQNFREIEITEYNLKVYWNGELIKKNDPRPEMEIYTQFMRNSDDPSCLFFCVTPLYVDRSENKIDFRLVCPAIFGDEGPHILSATWTIDGKEKRDGECERLDYLTFEGKTIPMQPQAHYYDNPLYIITLE